MSSRNGAPSAHPRLFTIKETLQELRLGETKVRELLATGELVSLRVGRRRLVPADAIANFIEARMAANAPGGGHLA